MDALEEEQEHLDATGEAYDRAFAALLGRKPPKGSDDYANEALEQMRRERIRVYTDASGPLYFGRVDEATGETLYVGRHAIWSADNQLLSVNWRAPAAEPFYSATAHDPKGVRRRRRLDIDDRRVLGFVDETLATEDDDHLTDAIVEDITRQRVGEMRQIISTITPGPVRADQPRGGRCARHPGRAGDRQDRGRPAPGRVAALRRPGPHARRRARRRPERDLHPLHRAGAAGARRRAASSSGRSAP